ncbi:MAG: caspase family protein [Rubrivivax sp.]|nr:caspase family protein [Rubrivivax sp.]
MTFPAGRFLRSAFRRLFAAGLAAFLAQLCGASLALAQGGAATAVGSKHALLIGNAQYAQSPLRNPENDARDLGEALRALGFEVTVLLNATRAQMLEATARFARRLDRNALSLVYFGGHGVQVGGRNFVLPILPANALKSGDDLPAQAVSLEAMMAPLASARPRFNLVVLDACRDNPFGDGRQRGGLAPLDAPPNTLVAFATSPGKVAFDGEGRNGTYTAHLLRHIGKRELRIEEVFKLVRAGVLEESRGRQLPWENTALVGELALAAYPQPLPTAAAVAAPEGPLAWVRDAAEPELRRFLGENRDSRTRAVVLQRLVALREKAPIRAEALALSERPCEGCPRMRALELPGAGTATAPLWVGADLVTTAELRRCIAARACAAPADLALAADWDPAQGVSAEVAQQYVGWLDALPAARRAGLRFFLPSEAQWLAVYRASFFREDGRPLFEGRSACRVANLYDESGAAANRFGWEALGCNDGFAEASPVGLFSPSLQGLFDLVGNVWQWTSTCTDPQSAGCRQYRLVGGSWATGGHWSWAEPPRLAAEPELGAPIFGLRVFAQKR